MQGIRKIISESFRNCSTHSGGTNDVDDAMTRTLADIWPQISAFVLLLRQRELVEEFQRFAWQAHWSTSTRWHSAPRVCRALCWHAFLADTSPSLQAGVIALRLVPLSLLKKSSLFSAGWQVGGSCFEHQCPKRLRDCISLGTFWFFLFSRSCGSSLILRTTPLWLKWGFSIMATCLAWSQARRGAVGLMQCCERPTVGLVARASGAPRDSQQGSADRVAREWIFVGYCWWADMSPSHG